MSVLYFLGLVVVVIYCSSLLFIFLYSLTQLDLLYHYLTGKADYKLAQSPKKVFPSLPKITVQLPIYNEQYVVERLLEAVTKLNYPNDLLEIQVLDDSTDETCQIILDKISTLPPQYAIRYLHRTDRSGYKAGALKAGLAVASGEYIAIFDADFVPQADFLRQVVPYFVDDQIGMVQTRWAHLNTNDSILTQSLALGMDNHFSIEQSGRNMMGSFINFNGTAGMWRKSCILDAGNWQADTLTEDLDLSYRAQLKGWKFEFVEEIATPSELPPVMSALKSQQYRWNKGGAETARKHLWAVLSSDLSITTKWHGAMHLLGCLLFLSSLTSSVTSVLVLIVKNYFPIYGVVYELSKVFIVSLFVIMAMFYASIAARKSSVQESFMVFLTQFPVFLVLTIGLSFHNTVAVVEGLMGRKTPFVRTPKFNDCGNWKDNKYVRNTGFNWMTLVEICLAVYFLFGVALSFYFQDFSLILFHTLNFMGYSVVVYYCVYQK
jgi:cellulose synthase/poly-beta-1,6-N-acetylglucosamine synthase-like glycosyltransferase